MGGFLLQRTPSSDRNATATNRMHPLILNWNLAIVAVLTDFTNMAVMLSDLLRNLTFNRSAHCTHVSDQCPLGLLFKIKQRRRDQFSTLKYDSICHDVLASAGFGTFEASFLNLLNYLLAKDRWWGFCTRHEHMVHIVNQIQFKMVYTFYNVVESSFCMTLRIVISKLRITKWLTFYFNNGEGDSMFNFDIRLPILTYTDLLYLFWF